MRIIRLSAALPVAFLLLVMFLVIPGCGRESEPLVVYAGKGLKYPLEEISENFRQREGIPVSIVYAGSDTLLTTLQKTNRGDVYIPGSSSYIKDAGALVTRDRFVAMHIPAFAVRAGNLRTYADLLAPGVRIAVGNKDMAAIGRIVEAMLKDTTPEQNFRHNIVITASTVNELLELVVDGEVDAALVWSDMLRWKAAKALALVEIPAVLNKPKEIRVCVLSTSLAPDRATRFADYVAGEGQKIFEKHGFGIK
jgi:molybdate transport system substrate-binding protein